MKGSESEPDVPPNDSMTLQANWALPCSAQDGRAVSPGRGEPSSPSNVQRECGGSRE